MGNELAKTKPADGALALDASTQAKMVESLVIRGDMSGLSPGDRARYYVHMCESLGLNPASQPFEYLRLNGKEILYAKRGATDQLAANHKLDREIIDGPKVIDLAGTKLVYAVARAKHPNGRVETSVATVPLVDPVNVLMKCETKAKRRVTLSILGLGILDEAEMDTIPDAVKEPGGGVDLSLASPGAAPDAGADGEPPPAEEQSSRAFSGFCDAIIKAPSLAEVHNLYNGLVADLLEEGADAEHFTGGDDGAGEKARTRMGTLGHKLSKEEAGIVLRDRPFAEVLDTQAHIAPGADALKLAAQWWIARRSDRATLEQAYQKKPWLPLVRRYSGATEGPKVKAAGAQLEAALKTMEPKPPTGGGGSSPGAPRDAAANGTGESHTSVARDQGNAALVEQLDLPAEPSGDVMLAWAKKLRDTRHDGGDNGAAHVAGSYWKRREAFHVAGLRARAVAITLDEIASRGISDPGAFLAGIGERNGYLTRPAKIAA